MSASAAARCPAASASASPIARALLKDPPILILDEATSALDAATEAAGAGRARRGDARPHHVRDRASARDRRNADRILVFDAGRIVESGSFEELVRLRKRFAALAAAQFMIPMPDAVPAMASTGEK